jgi:hypothetical protein
MTGRNPAIPPLPLVLDPARARSLVAAVAALLALVVSCSEPHAAPDDGEGPRLAIYRVTLAVPDSLRHGWGPGAPTHNIVSSQELFLERAVKSKPPVLTEAEIEVYCWDSQTLHLTPAGERRWNALGGGRVPLEGLPLLVEVEGRPRYGALLWNPASSLASRLPTFWSLAVEGRVRLAGHYLTAEGDTTWAATYDPEVHRVMEELGKLSEDCGED